MIPLLKNNDIIYFQDSASNKIDTFNLDVSNEMLITTEREYFQYINIYYNKSNIKSTLLRIYITSASGIGPLFYIDNYYSKATFVSTTKTNFTLHGVTYPIVFVLHDYDYYNLYPDSIPNTVYYTYPNGIIRYEYKDGRVYQLVSK